MNIAIVSDYAYPYTKGGAETRYYTLAQYLINHGHQVTWFTSKQWEDKSKVRLDGINYEAICQENYPYNRSGNRSIKQAIIFGISAFKLLTLKQKYDLIDCSQYPIFHLFPVKLFSIIKRTSFVTSWYEFWGNHWLEYAGRIKGPIGKFFEKWAARLSENIIVISEQAQKKLIINKCNITKINYVPNWIDYVNIISLPPKGSFYDVCYFGRLKNHKNVNLIIRAIALCKEKGYKLNTKIFGDGPERQGLEKLSKELNVRSNIEFFGRIEDYNDLLGYVKSSKICVNVTTKEGGGSITTLEANACGVPVIAVDNPLGIDKSLILDGFNGYWIKNATAEALSIKLIDYFNNDINKLPELRKNAKDWTKSYSSNNLCRRVEKIYQKIVA